MTLPIPPVDNFHPLTNTLQQGMIPLSIFALCSALSTFSLLSWITYRLLWRQDYQAFMGYNQYVILIYNLLLADLQQSLAFLITLNWLRIGGVNSPSTTCFAQAWLLNMGDVSSGFFVLAIALHTWYSVVLGRKLDYKVFLIGVLSVWVAAFTLTVLGPVTKGPHFFAITNAWVCRIKSLEFLTAYLRCSVGLIRNMISIAYGFTTSGSSLLNSAPLSSTPTYFFTSANASIPFVPFIRTSILLTKATASPKPRATWYYTLPYTWSSLYLWLPVVWQPWPAKYHLFNTTAWPDRSLHPAAGLTRCYTLSLAECL
jgi:hypothetical protein